MSYSGPSGVILLKRHADRYDFTSDEMEMESTLRFNNKLHAKKYAIIAEMHAIEHENRVKARSAIKDVRRPSLDSTVAVKKRSWFMRLFLCCGEPDN